MRAAARPALQYEATERSFVMAKHFPRSLLFWSFDLTGLSRRLTRLAPFHSQIIPEFLAIRSRAFEAALAWMSSGAASEGSGINGVFFLSVQKQVLLPCRGQWGKFSV